MIKEVNSNFKFGDVDLSYILDFSKGNRNFVLLSKTGKSFLGGFVTDNEYNLKKTYVMPYVKNKQSTYIGEMTNYANERKAKSTSVLEALKLAHTGGIKWK